MNILLDSHILLWTLDGSSQMAEKGRELITDAHNEISRFEQARYS